METNNEDIKAIATKVVEELTPLIVIERHKTFAYFDAQWKSLDISFNRSLDSVRDDIKSQMKETDKRNKEDVDGRFKKVWEAINKLTENRYIVEAKTVGISVGITLLLIAGVVYGTR